ncbi:hypothetical protein [Rossellomorea aquimaris]|uniref:hypothetical protein n=1 Tax=Rossellomorea aquimaris TaxID=189382 RepID=UPI0007D04535|nr:hypothetical protein [Rossellomorea aquimaris]
MIIPNLFQDKLPPSSEEIVSKLLESIVEEEIAITNLISSEADKITAFVGEKNNFPTNPTNQEIITFNQTIYRIIESLLMKEWLLLKKIETVLSLKEKLENENKNEIKNNPPLIEEEDQ